MASRFSVAITTVYARARHQSCWVHKMRKILERMRKRDYDEVKRDAQATMPRHLWRKLRTTNVIERCFVEVQGRTRPTVCFGNVESVDRVIYSIFHRFNLEWKTRTLSLITQQPDITFFRSD